VTQSQGTVTEKGEAMARKKRNPMYISLTEQERLRFDRLNEIENRSARAQLMVMVDEKLKARDPRFLKDSKAADE